MGVDDVEALGVVVNLAKHPKVVRRAHVVEPFKAQSLGKARSQRHLGGGIARREQRYVVPAASQLFGNIGDHPLSATVKLGRNAFVQRRDLCDPKGAIDE